jgi:5-methylcytosine-specific restriction endonuclease McrA
MQDCYRVCRSCGKPTKSLVSKKPTKGYCRRCAASIGGRASASSGKDRPYTKTDAWLASRAKRTKPRISGYIEGSLSKVRFDNCLWCAKPLHTGIKYKRDYCSHECGIRYHSMKRTNVNSPTECVQCGCVFNLIYNPNEPKLSSTCSIQCSKTRAREIFLASRARARAKRRAKERGLDNESINPYLVFRRDGWMCKGCGVDTPPHLRGTLEPNSPQVDHIIPLAAGGTHLYSNVQTLCRACNGLKGTRHWDEFVLSRRIQINGVAPIERCNLNL